MREKGHQQTIRWAERKIKMHRSKKVDEIMNEMIRIYQAIISRMRRHLKTIIADSAMAPDVIDKFQKEIAEIEKAVRELELLVKNNSPAKPDFTGLT